MQEGRRRQSGFEASEDQSRLTKGGTGRPSDADVARLAYERYEARGREDGHALEDWLDAERELTAVRPSQ
jgi:hypothetical protein